MMKVPCLVVFIFVSTCFGSVYSSEINLSSGAARNTINCPCICTDIWTAAIQCSINACQLQLCVPQTSQPIPTTSAPTTTTRLPATTASIPRSPPSPNNCFGGKRRFVAVSREFSGADPCPDPVTKTVLQDNENPQIRDVEHQTDIQFRCC